eukprot:2416518-Prymnesium_polylepis.1
MSRTSEAGSSSTSMPEPADECDAGCAGTLHVVHAAESSTVFAPVVRWAHRHRAALATDDYA